MHDYQTALCNRTRIIASMMTVSVIFFLAVGGLLQMAGVSNLPFWLSAPPAAAVFGVMIAIYDKYVWRWSILGHRLSAIPIVAGHWTGTVTLMSDTKPISSEGSLRCIVLIRQTWSKIEICFETRETISHSCMGSLNDRGRNPSGLHYEFLVEPRVGRARPNMEVHWGTAHLEPSGGDWLHLDGAFYNGKGYQRFGEYHLEKVPDRQHADKWLAERDVVESQATPGVVGISYDPKASRSTVAQPSKAAGGVSGMPYKRQYHIKCGPGDIGRYVLLPGDPSRCEVIASHFDGGQLVASNREFTTWTGTLDGESVSVTSTGIGGPSTAIAVEEVAQLGARTVIRVGTCGAIQADVKKGQLIVATASVRDEGTALQYVPLAYPAVASHEVVQEMIAALAAEGTSGHVGVVQSKDSFYGQTRPGSMPTAARLSERWDAWRKSGVLVSEMECATLFTVAALRGMRAGAILLCVNEPPYVESTSAIEELPIEDLVKAAIATVRRLINLDHRASMENLGS